MGMTNAERRRLAKRKSKERRVRKAANIRRNVAKLDFRLDVELDGKWREGVLWFRNARSVEAYRSETEAKRRQGQEIAPGRVVRTATGRTVLEIYGSKPKGAAPDAIADGPKADPDVVGELEVVTEPKEVVTGEPDK